MVQYAVPVGQSPSLVLSHKRGYLDYGCRNIQRDRPSFQCGNNYRGTNPQRYQLNSKRRKKRCGNDFIRQSPANNWSNQLLTQLVQLSIRSNFRSVISGLDVWK
ncbi:hypothetical protein GCM10011348_15780 [Marinobacterium nitratireducens]|uniref:Uncharacterized protein n=1 Tax=Marinobacterium nitratireducens TaxID=518897 RepID=A0A918DQG6_9GAMM|nr:hypothetical protein GCM10011348_15780 [Marinobacterium nitratireducens]